MKGPRFWAPHFERTPRYAARLRLPGFAGRAVEQEGYRSLDRLLGKLNADVLELPPPSASKARMGISARIRTFGISLLRRRLGGVFVGSRSSTRSRPVSPLTKCPVLGCRMVVGMLMEVASVSIVPPAGWPGSWLSRPKWPGQNAFRDP